MGITTAALFTLLQKMIQMNRMTLIVTALCLIMIATVGTGAVAAQQENLRQAGSSSIHFYDVAPTDMHGKGKLQINLDKHAFEFNGQGFEPSAQVALRARAAGSTNYVVFATGEATPSGNLHMAGTWAADAAPADVIVGPWEIQLHSFSLYNGGGFIAKLACYYSTDGGVTWQESSASDNILLTQYRNVELSDLGVPEGALVKIHAIVVAGNDRTGSDVWTYHHYDPSYSWTWQYAGYEITGTTLNSKLYWCGQSDGFADPYGAPPCPW